VLGVRTESGMAYLDTPVPAPPAVDLVPPGIDPRRVLRFASHCVSDCAHWQREACSLVEKIVVTVPAAGGGAAGGGAAGVPRCHLRPRCRWWRQTGPAACRRCPLVETFVAAGDADRQRVADPATRPEDLR
jgi:hypothetical protein